MPYLLSELVGDLPARWLVAGNSLIQTIRKEGGVLLYGVKIYFA